MPYQMIFQVDGACRGNGQRNAIGGVGVVRVYRDGRMKGWRQGLDYDDHIPTNQRAELWAIRYALEIALEKRDELHDYYQQWHYVKVVVYSDSRYAVDCMTRWIGIWRENHWLNSRGYPVANQDIIQEIDWLWERVVEEDRGGEVQFRWIPREQNQWADELANEACDDQY